MKKRLLAAALCAAVLSAAVPTAGAANTAPAAPTGNSIYVNGVQVNGAAYMINNNNYFKLRDIAAMVNGSAKQFEVSWNQAAKRIDLTTGAAYTAVGGELAAPSAQSKNAVLTSAVVYKNGSPANYTGYNIDSNNYYKLRDLCRDMNIGVKFDAASKRVDILTNEGYTEDSGTAAAAITKWNSTMYDFNEAMIDCNWNQAKYLEVVNQYGAAITGKANATTSEVVAALEAMTGAPVDAVSMDDKPVNQFWAKELRKAMGETVEDDNNNNGSNTNNGNNSNINNGSQTTVTEATLRQWEQEMIERVNEERAKVGAPALEVDDDLMAFAQYWAEHLTTDFRHSAWSEIEAFANANGIDAKRIGGNENISGVGNVNGMGYGPVTIAMNKFMNSEGHRNTLLSKEYTRIGIGFAVADSGAAYCCQKFGF